MESDEKSQGLTPQARALAEAISDRIKAQNDTDRQARNARRWKAERDPAEYEAQKERQRRQYQPRGGEAVRPYAKIIAGTAKEHDKLAKARDADRQRGKYASLSPADRQAKSDKIADEAWLARRRKKGMPEDALIAALAVHIQNRTAKRIAQSQAEAEELALRDDPRNILG